MNFFVKVKYPLPINFSTTEDTFCYNNVINDYIYKLNKQKNIINYLNILNKNINNIEKNLILLYNMNNQDQILTLDGCQNLNLHPTKSWKDQLLILLFSANVPLSWIVDVTFKLNDFIFSKNILTEHPTNESINVVYIKTINYITKEKIKKLIKLFLNNLK
jgi:hypothetical protein